MTLNQGVPAIVRSPPKRSTFRHGNLPDALLNAALLRIETHGSDSITLRDLARDTGVNHRAIYRHFPDKESLLADVAERRSEEHTSELQSRENLVCRLLLE